MKKLFISKEAKKLIDIGFKGNGCGSGFISHILCWLAQKVIKVDLELVWDYHDAEYSIPYKKRSLSHKEQADYYVHKNIDLLANIDKTSTGFKVKFARGIHAVLILKGHNAYWSK